MYVCISPLHKWIRCFEMLIHISYRLEIRKWRVTAGDKATVSARKKMIHDRFKSELGLRVDEPKQGAGNSNDGNTARRAFEHEQTFANICGLDEDLIHRLHMVMVALSCKLPINPDTFGTYCKQTAELLVQPVPMVLYACEHPCPFNSWSFDPSILHPANRDDERGSSGSQEQGQ